eukprot:SAG22_NODE_136_length_18095_cov_19.897255_22_plen_171_part_00
MHVAATKKRRRGRRRRRFGSLSAAMTHDIVPVAALGVVHVVYLNEEGMDGVAFNGWHAWHNAIVVQKHQGGFALFHSQVHLHATTYVHVAALSPVLPSIYLFRMQYPDDNIMSWMPAWMPSSYPTDVGFFAAGLASQPAVEVEPGRLDGGVGQEVAGRQALQASPTPTPD